VKQVSRLASTIGTGSEKRLYKEELLVPNIPDPQFRAGSFRDNVFKRDNYQCVLSNVYTNSKDYRKNILDNAKKGNVEAAHIIPFAYGKYKPQKDQV
jgi:hypothetical protein